MNRVLTTSLKFKSISGKHYQEERKAELGEFLGSIIAGIYEGIKIALYDVGSNYQQVAGRPH
ncbi:hypothetical protein GCM10028791_41930 [Echinicola sediminis]